MIWNSGTGILSLSGSLNAEQWQDIPAPGDLPKQLGQSFKRAPRAINFVVGDKIYAPGTNHFYGLFLQKVFLDKRQRLLLKLEVIFGMQGYLVTVASSGKKCIDSLKTKWTRLDGCE